MNDTDRVPRQPEPLPPAPRGPRPRPARVQAPLAAVHPNGGDDAFSDMTPTTSPSWATPPEVRLRMARGSLVPVPPPVDGEIPALPPLPPRGIVAAPPVATPTPAPRARRATPKWTLEEAMEIGVRPIAPPRDWGDVVAVDHDGQQVRRRRRAAVTAPPPVAEPVPLPTRPIAAVAAVVGLFSAAVVLGAVIARSGASTPARAPSAATAVAAPPAAPAPAPQLVVEHIGDATTIEPIVADDPGPELEEIEIAAESRPAPRPRATAPAPAPTPARAVTAPVTAPVAAPVAAPDDVPAAPPADGLLMVNSKPPCRILVDGEDTGLVTPQRELTLPAGRHTITLVNDEYGIEERATVTVKADQPVKLIRDLTDRLPQ